MRLETGADMNGKTSKHTRNIAFTSILSALSVVFLCIGIFLPTLDLVAAMIASYAVILTVCELGRGYAVGVFASSAVLGLIIAPQNSAALFYAVFMGYYPILKSFIEVKLRKRIAAIAVKLLSFNVAFFIILFVGIKFFAFEKFIGWYAIGIVVLAEFAFILYDIALTKIIFIYFRTARARLHIGRFLKK